MQNGKYGYIDDDGKVVIGPQFIWADNFWRGLGTVFVCGRYVSIDPSGALHPLRVALDGQLEPKKKVRSSDSSMPLGSSKSLRHLTSTFVFRGARRSA